MDDETDDEAEIEVEIEAGDPSPAAPTMAELTEFLRIAAFDGEDVRAFATGRVDDAREFALVAAYSRIGRICDADLPGG